jgi:hypothetical protein
MRNIFRSVTLPMSLLVVLTAAVASTRAGVIPIGGYECDPTTQDCPAPAPTPETAPSTAPSADDTATLADVVVGVLQTLLSLT